MKEEGLTDNYNEKFEESKPKNNLDCLKILKYSIH